MGRSAVALAVVSVLAAARMAPAEAQTTSTALEEIVVTAQFREQRVQDIPVSLTAVSAEMLEARNQVSVADITNQAPNVTLKPAAGPFGPTLQAFIRGIGQYDFNYALEPGVGMYIDDVYFATITGSNFDLLDLDRVEVLRGPQGTLAGQNSIGGAIKLYSKKPQGDDTGSVQVTYGRFNRTDVRASADMSLVEDRLFARIAGVSRHVDGYVTRYDFACAHPDLAQQYGIASRVIGEDCKLGTEGGKAYNAARLALRWLATDRLEVNLSGDYTNDNSEASPLTLVYVGTCPAGQTCASTSNGIAPRAGSFNGLTTNNLASGLPMGTATGSVFIPYSPFGFYQAQNPFSTSPYVNFSDYTNTTPISTRATDAEPGTNAFSIPPVNQVDSYGFAGTLDYEITDNLSLKSISAYRHYSGQWSIDEDATPISTGTLHNQVWHRQFSQELRLNAHVLDAVHFTVGGYYLRQKSHYGGRINLEPSRLDFIEDDYIPGKTMAAFVNADWEVTDSMNLITGARYTEQEKTFEYGRRPVPGALNGTQGAALVLPLHGLSQTFEGEELDWRVALQYRWMPELMTYAQVSTGFKGGGINPRPFFASQAQPFDSETLRAYELGFKSDLLGGTWRLNGAVFFNKYDDIILTVSTCPPTHQSPQFPNNAAFPCAAPINAGKADVQGAELETEIHLFGGLSLDATASYLDFEYTELSPLAQGAGLTLDMTTPFAPKWKYSAGAQYVFELGDAGTLTPRVDWSYQAAFHSQPVNHAVNRVPNYYVMNGRISWQSVDRNWDVALEGTNLTNKLYYLTFFDNRTSTQNVFGQPAPPRQWAVTLRRSFR